MPSDPRANSMHRSAGKADYRLAGSNTGFKEDTRAKIRRLDAARQERLAPGRSEGLLDGVFRRSIAEYHDA
jgi:hypothetical protein